MLLMPFPYIANEAGWVVSEVGRQPWIIYGLMRTARGVSPTVAGGEAVFTLIGFAGMYFLLGVLFLYLVLREIALGPTVRVVRARRGMSTLAFVVIAFMLTMYVLLDGYDLGCGVDHAVRSRAAIASGRRRWRASDRFGTATKFG